MYSQVVKYMYMYICTLNVSTFNSNVHVHMYSTSSQRSDALPPFRSKQKNILINCRLMITEGILENK